MVKLENEQNQTEKEHVCSVGEQVLITGLNHHSDDYWIEHIDTVYSNYYVFPFHPIVVYHLHQRRLKQVIWRILDGSKQIYRELRPERPIDRRSQGLQYDNILNPRPFMPLFSSLTARRPLLVLLLFFNFLFKYNPILDFRCYQLTLVKRQSRPFHFANYLLALLKGFI